MADTNAALLLPAPGAPTNAAAAIEELRDIKGPVHVPNSLAWLGWVLAAAVLAAAAWFAWKKLRVRKPAAPAAVLVPPHRRAKEQLRRATELMSDPYAFCSLVSTVVRGYIEDRFDLRAPERTTEEFLDELRRTNLLHVEHKRLLEDFLTRCDLVKFARHEPTQPELEALLDAALRFVDETTLASEPVAATPPQPAA
jgi:hypothetical protein